MIRPAHGLRYRLVIAFALFSVATSALFSLFCILFVYSVEDSFFDNILQEEVGHQRSSWKRTGALAIPLRDFVTVYRNAGELPADLRAQLTDLPMRGEFFGEQGRYYHLRTEVPQPGAMPFLIVAEVSRHLVVRPVLPTILTVLVVLAAGVLLLTLGLGYWLAYRTTTPLVRLAALVSSAEPHQLPDRFAHQFPSNEIGVLAHNLEHAWSRIRQFIERERQFTQDASHELRTPIAVIRGAADLLAQQPMAPLAADQLQRIGHASAQMEQTVATLLALAREAPVEATEQVTLLPLIENAVIQLAYLLAGKPVEVQVDVPADFAVIGHRAVMAILLSNLISNAFTHTSQGQIRIITEDHCVVISDSGSGIEPALQNRMYEPNVKGADSTGFGLGLSIVRRLCDRFGIELQIDSTPATGTRAVMRFQRVQPGAIKQPVTAQMANP